MEHLNRTGHTFTVRSMTRAEVDLALNWAAAEGWNPGIHDADCFYATDPNGFFIGELEGEPIACLSAAAYDERFGFLGLYIVKPEFRGKGFGLQIWKAGLAYLGKRNIGLDGVVTQQENYRKSGFKLAYRNIRYEGRGGRFRSQNIVNLSALPFKELTAYDSGLFPVQRAQFLRCWIEQPEGAALGILCNGHLIGYGVLRACRRGFKIGPLFADDAGSAEQLFQALASQVPDAPIFLDVPAPNAAAVDLAQRHTMKIVFETARMYTQEPPLLPLERCFGVTTFELG